MRFRQARNYYKGRLSPVRLLVIHCTATPRNSSTAAGIASYFSSTTRKASAHCTFDKNEGWESVKPWDTAFGAAKANADGYHIEHIGLGRESRGEWLDGYGYPMLTLSAQHAADRAREFDIPLRWLTVAEVRDRHTRGFTDHLTVQRAFPSTGHTDPGVNFPHDVYMDLVKQYSTINPEDDDMAKFTDELAAELDLVHKALFDNAGHLPNGAGVGVQKEGSALYLLQNINHQMNVIADRLAALEAKP